METKVCSSCKQEKLLTEFGWKVKRKHYQSACKPCQRIISKQWYIANRKRQIRNAVVNGHRYKDIHTKALFEYLKQHPCIDCGETNPIKLEFDHVRGKKKCNVSTLIGYTTKWSTIQKEIDKCEVRCANCHSFVTAQRGRHRMYRLWIEENTNGIKRLQNR